MHNGLEVPVGRHRGSGMEAAIFCVTKSFGRDKRRLLAVWLSGRLSTALEMRQLQKDFDNHIATGHQVTNQTLSYLNERHDLAFCR